MRILNLFVLLICTMAFSSTAFVPSAQAEPKTIFIIRHAEKPDADKTSPDLSKKGYERAEALAAQFVDKFARPDFLFATQKSKSSNRPVETITPLAKKLNQPIDSTFADNDYDKLAHELLTNPKYNDKVILIAWHKGRIPDLATALGVKDAPAEWKADTFDRVWKITFDNNKAKLQDLPQNLLPGDSEH